MNLCTGKVAFESFKQADAVRKRCRANIRTGARVYKCDECGKFHIGTGLARKKHKPKYNMMECEI